MDSKKVIETLVKIAEKQQKVINKLAQQVGTPMGGAPKPPPTLQAVKEAIVKHLVAAGIPQQNAQEYVAKKTDSLNLAGNVLNGELVTSMKTPDAMKNKILKAINDACKELGCQSNVLFYSR